MIFMLDHRTKFGDLLQPSFNSCTSAVLKTTTVSYSRILWTIFSYLIYPNVSASRYLNPVHTWCYMGEDTMSKARPLVNSSVKGNVAWKVSGKAMDRYRRALDATLSQPRMWLNRI